LGRSAGRALRMLSPDLRPASAASRTDRAGDAGLIALRHEVVVLRRFSRPSPGSSEDAPAFRPGRNRIPAEQGGERAIAARAIGRRPRGGVSKPALIKSSQLSVLPDRFGFMTTDATTDGDAGHARYTYRLRVSAGARAALEAEWDRCR